MMIEIQDLESVQKDVLLRRANIKKKCDYWEACWHFEHNGPEFVSELGRCFSSLNSILNCKLMCEALDLDFNI